MERVDDKELAELEPFELDRAFDPRSGKELSPEEFNSLLVKMNTPSEAQKEIAAHLSVFLSRQVKREMSEKGALSDYTRRWVSEYNNLLSSLQKSLYGDKSLNLHVHSVSHHDISRKIRKYSEQTVTDKVVEEE